MDNEIINVTTVDQYNQMFGFETLHPQVNVIDFAKVKVNPFKVNLGLYALFLKEGLCGELLYGRGSYDYQEGTIVCYGPGQIVGVRDGSQPDGGYTSALGVIFSPEFIRGTSLGQRIKEFTFFSYSVNEALHLSDQEKEIVRDCIQKIRIELGQSIDKHSKRLIAMNIELLLDYCLRFYDRQFITRNVENKDVLARFEQLIDDYFQYHAQSEGLPTVAYFADKICLSPNYFGDLIKKETGKSAMEYIQLKIMATAKDMLRHSNKTVTEIAYELGFQYPQHFVRSFKKRVGCTPSEFRLQA